MYAYIHITLRNTHTSHIPCTKTNLSFSLYIYITLTHTHITHTIYKNQSISLSFSLYHTDIFTSTHDSGFQVLGPAMVSMG